MLSNWRSLSGSHAISAAERASIARLRQCWGLWSRSAIPRQPWA
jgi:hypothetical protein